MEYQRHFPSREIGTGCVPTRLVRGQWHFPTLMPVLRAHGRCSISVCYGRGRIGDKDREWAKGEEHGDEFFRCEGEASEGGDVYFAGASLVCYGRQEDKDGGLAALARRGPSSTVFRWRTTEGLRLVVSNWSWRVGSELAATRRRREKSNVDSVGLAGDKLGTAWQQRERERERESRWESMAESPTLSISHGACRAGGGQRCSVRLDPNYSHDCPVSSAESTRREARSAGSCAWVTGAHRRGFGLDVPRRAWVLASARRSTRSTSRAP
jgi:hypothetical protein